MKTVFAYLKKITTPHTVVWTIYFMFTISITYTAGKLFETKTSFNIYNKLLKINVLIPNCNNLMVISLITTHKTI